MWEHADPTHALAWIRFMAFDRHMNLVLGDSEEFRKLPPKKGKSEEEVSARPQQAFLLNSNFGGDALLL